MLTMMSRWTANARLVCVFPCSIHSSQTTDYLVKSVDSAQRNEMQIKTDWLRLVLDMSSLQHVINSLQSRARRTRAPAVANRSRDHSCSRFCFRASDTLNRFFARYKFVTYLLTYLLANLCQQSASARRIVCTAPLLLTVDDLLIAILVVCWFVARARQELANSVEIRRHCLLRLK